MSKLLESAGEEIFGQKWKGKLSRALGMDASTLWRHLNKEDVEGPIKAAVTGWLLLYRAFHVLPPEKPEEPFRQETHDTLPLTEQIRPQGFDATFIEELGPDLFGKKWKLPLAAALGVNPSTLWRQMSEGGLSPQVVAAMRSWELTYKTMHLLPPAHPGGPYRPAQSTPNMQDGVRGKQHSRSRYADLIR